MDKRKILLIAGIVATVIISTITIYILAARGSDNKNEPGESVVLEYWGLWEPEEVMKPLIEEYQDLNPNVTVIYTQRSFDQYEQTLYTRLEQSVNANSPAPDIFRINNSWLSRVYPYLSPLPQSVMSSSEYRETFHEIATKDFGSSDGTFFAIPLEIDGLALFYNKEIFEEAGLDQPPNNWNDLRDLAIQLTEKDESGKITRAGIGMGSGGNVLHSPDILSLLMLQNGSDPNPSPYKEVDFSESSTIEAMEFYTEFATVHKVWDVDSKSDLELFFNGELPMMFGPSWRAFDIIESNPRIEFGIVPTPNITESDELYYPMYWGEAVSKTSKNTEEAWKFIKFLSEKEQMKQFFNNSVNIAGRAFGEPYSRKDIGEELLSNPYARPFIEMAPNMVGWQKGEQYFMEEQLRIAIDEVAINEVDADSALQEAADNINERLADTIPSD